ncbi:MAG TPA: hypothetical protein VMJ10_26795, partial [Kofleriaceae bacterium]|nr:hypothetical protein [Kofleriaceae bacterium]
MADLSSLLTVYEHDPDDAQVLGALPAAARAAAPELAAHRFAAARKLLSSRGRPDAVVALIEAELSANDDANRKADLYLEQGMVLESEVCDPKAARAAFERVLELRANDAMAKEGLDEVELSRANWQKFAAKYVKEATASTDRSLATGLYASAAEAYVKFSPDAPEAEQYLRKALEIDGKNGKAAFHLGRLLRRAERWQDLGELLDDRAERAATPEERVAALLELHEIARGPIGNAPRAERAVKRAIGIDPA